MTHKPQLLPLLATLKEFAFEIDHEITTAEWAYSQDERNQAIRTLIPLIERMRTALGLAETILALHRQRRGP